MLRRRADEGRDVLGSEPQALATGQAHGTKCAVASELAHGVRRDAEHLSYLVNGQTMSKG